jgi:4-hydroxy-tetrahydrodipicolinate reductase
MKPLVKAIVLGAAGRMGVRIISLMKESGAVCLGAAVEVKGHPSLGADAGETAGIQRLGIPITEDLASVIDHGQVVIDFTTPQSTLANLDISVKKSKPLVIGTTGLGSGELEQIKKATAKLPCVLSPNMSIGVNVMFKIVGEVANLLGQDYDMEIIEAHHRFKKDAPSGTALRLAQILAQAAQRPLEELATYARKGQVGERKKSEIGIQAIRAGDIVGEHTVIFGGMGERLEITHRAHSRDNFARGALLAAKWVVHQPPGFYEMAHVLGLSPLR